MTVMKFIRQRKGFLGAFLVSAVYNVYFMWLLPGVKLHYLEYLNLLVAAGLLACLFLRFLKYRREEQEAGDKEEKTAAKLEQELKKQFSLNCDLQDYIAKWCHEVKLPLSAALLIAEKLESGEEKAALQEQLERMNQLLANALLGCKVQSSLFDLQIRHVSLQECVRASIHNNQFFLIQKHFDMDIRVEECFVYTDKAWLVYVLDQIISNAVKYAGERASLIITGGGGTGEFRPGGIRLAVEDRGMGIKADELKRVFDRGFTGSNHHNGQYKSTGMGLYMAKLIADRLGHGLTVESVYGEYTRFEISFSDNREYFLQEM